MVVVPSTAEAASLGHFVGHQVRRGYSHEGFLPRCVYFLTIAGKVNLWGAIYGAFLTAPLPLLGTWFAWSGIGSGMVLVERRLLLGQFLQAVVVSSCLVRRV